MAIAKIEQRSSTVWSRGSLMTAGAGAVLALVSLFLLWGAIQRFMVRTNYVEGVFKHDSNRRQEVKSHAEKAQSWGRHGESKELLAKALAESNQLDAADKLYTQIASGPRRAMGACGQGLVLLRKADAEKDPKKCAELAKKAKDRFGEAKAADPGLIEAQVGSATADLIAGVRMNDGTKINAARAELSKIHKALQNSEDLAKEVTREGFTDLYVGLARAHASPAKFSPEALAFAGSARRYIPGSMSLLAMELSLQAQQMAESPLSTAEIRAVKTLERLNLLRQRILTSQKAMEDVAEPWLALTLATASALARGGDLAGSKAMLEMAATGTRSQNSFMPAVLEASLALEATQAPEVTGNWIKRQTNYSLAYSLFVKVNQVKELEDPSRAALRAAMLNNQAFLEEDMAAQGGGEARYENAVKLLKRALEADQQAGIPEGSYEVLRNLAVIQKRRGKPEAADFFTAAQRTAVGRSEDWVRRDLEELQKFFSPSKGD